MAKRVITKLVDDLDGSDANETITFSLDGSEYEIDLNEAHADELREALSKYRTVGRKTGGRGRPARPSSTGSQNTKAVRAWRSKRAFQSTPAAASRLT